MNDKVAEADGRGISKDGLFVRALDTKISREHGDSNLHDGNETTEWVYLETI
jgi:hypothetical protein